LDEGGMEFEFNAKLFFPQWITLKSFEMAIRDYMDMGQ
jgi:hypothetical protein